MKVKVFFTVDVEVWCNGWDNLDERFPAAFRRYVYGPTKKGDFGLTRTLDGLNEHGLKGVFFTEPLFSARFGRDPLTEIVGLVQDAGQEVQLHLHTEWANEATPPLIPGVREKRQNICMFDRVEQRALIETGLRLLQRAGAKEVNAFRAGSFGLNADTWRALRDAGIPFDSSFNALLSPGSDDLDAYRGMHQPRQVEGVWVYPMTQFVDATGRRRHAQLGACSFGELEWLLWRAAEESWDSVVILSHNFELMNRGKDRPDPVVHQRFRRLCRFLRDNADAFETVGFGGLEPPAVERNPSIPQSAFPMTVGRLIEQAWRQVYR